MRRLKACRWTGQVEGSEVDASAGSEVDVFVFFLHSEDEKSRLPQKLGGCGKAVKDGSQDMLC